MKSAIRKASRTTVWINLKIVREACICTLAGSASHPELEKLVEEIRLIVKSGNVDNARALFLADPYLWPSA